MGALTLAPATVADLLALYARRGMETPLRDDWHAALVQVLEGPAVSISTREGISIGLAGIFYNKGMGEAWLKLAPGAERNLLGLVRILGRLMRGECRRSGLPILARVQPDNPAGRLLARAAGLTTAELDEGGRQVYRLEVDAWKKP